MVSLAAILGPSALTLFVVIWMCQESVLDVPSKIALTIFYLISLFMCLRNFYKVSFTEPGILPSMRKNNSSVKFADPIRDYYVEYLSKAELAETMRQRGVRESVDKYYNLKKFKYMQTSAPFLNDNQEVQPFIEPKKKHNKLSYCTTCEHLRPPRSFHCSQCGVCIEVHDHHCPWVGTCIGYRNLKYFIAFLFWTGMHGLVTFSICLTMEILCSSCWKDPNQAFYAYTMRTILIYSAFVGGCLLTFASYQVCSLGLRNVASNEDIRHRWNGHKRNRRYAKLYRKESGCCARFTYIIGFGQEVDEV